MADPADLLAAGLGDRLPPLPDAADLAQLLPAYELGPLIGRGGMGAVFRARHRELDRTVALKVLLFHTQPAAVARFRTEARVLARLDHPHIVRIFDVGENDGLCWLAMEFIDGTDLRRAMAEKRLAPADILALVPQVCTALQYAHDQGVVHRDIKPENLLIDHAGKVHIADFGLAHLHEAGDRPRLTAMGMTMGTPHYMAPEQVERPQSVDHRADLYALGVVFYEMLTGELPLGRFPLPSRKVTVDVRIDEVVLRALEKEPERRYQQARHLGNRVEQIAAHPPWRRWPVIIAGSLLLAGLGASWRWMRPQADADVPVPAITAAAPPAEAQAAILRQALIDADLLRDERFTTLRDRFTPSWRTVMDDVDCARQWHALAAEGGIFLGFAPPVIDHATVRMIARWQTQARELAITYDAQDRITGLWLHPTSD